MNSHEHRDVTTEMLLVLEPCLLIDYYADLDHVRHTQSDAK
jgi:hypothetical protein